ncbi:MAG: tetratricopeptide repeat protein [Candidatus Latescibacteria bacterium]|nr:tetratricopeptide repeat protein [Candidatus Latescibacterota bacterium]
MTRRLALFLLLATALGAVYEWGGPAGRGVRDLKAKRYDDALRALREGRSDHPGDAVLPFDEALAYLGKGELDSAIVRYREAMTSRGDRARAAASFNLGNEAMRAKRFQEAAGLYRESLRVRPDNADAKRNLEEAIRLARGITPQTPAQGGGDGPPTAGGGRGPLAAGDSSRAAGEPRSESAPRGASPEFSKQEAERWLEALEAERRGSRHQGKTEAQRETGRRDW